MIKKMRPRWFCDHCGKGSGSASYMKRHEAGCTANPNRACGLCREADLLQQPTADLIVALGPGDKAGLDALRDLAEGCPACILTAIRQSGLQCPAVYDDTGAMISEGFNVDFQFKVELKQWWDQRNQDSNEW